MDSTLERSKSPSSDPKALLEEVKKQLLIAKRKVDHLSEENILINTAILKHMQGVVPAPSRSAEEDLKAHSLKSEIEVLVCSSKSYAYKSPAEEFEAALRRDFAAQPEAFPKISAWVNRTLREAPQSFTSGKYHSLNLEALVEAKETVRHQLEVDRKLQEEEERQERLRQEEALKEKARKAKLKREEELKKKPWLRKKTEPEKTPFDFAFAGSAVSSTLLGRNY